MWWLEQEALCIRVCLPNGVNLERKGGVHKAGHGHRWCELGRPGEAGRTAGTPPTGSGERPRLWMGALCLFLRVSTALHMLAINNKKALGKWWITIANFSSLAMESERIKTTEYQILKFLKGLREIVWWKMQIYHPNYFLFRLILLIRFASHMVIKSGSLSKT